MLALPGFHQPTYNHASAWYNLWIAPTPRTIRIGLGTIRGMQKYSSSDAGTAIEPAGTITLADWNHRSPEVGPGRVVLPTKLDYLRERVLRIRVYKYPRLSFNELPSHFATSLFLPFELQI